MHSHRTSRMSVAAVAVLGLSIAGCGGGAGEAAAPGDFGPLPGMPVITAATPHCTEAGPAFRITWTPAANAVDYVLFRDGVLRAGALFQHDFAFEDPADSVPHPTYRYVVRAVNAIGFTDSLGVLVGLPKQTCLVPPPPPPPGPGAFAIVGAESRCEPAGPAIRLTWTASSDATQYDVYRDGALRAGALPEGTLSFDDVADVAAGGTYRYVVRAVNASGELPTPPVEVVVPMDVCPAPPQPLPGPFDVIEATAHCTPGGPAIRISWTLSEHATRYEVIRVDDLKIVQLPENTLSFEDVDGILAGETRTYRVVAWNDAGGEDSGKFDVDVPADVCPEAPPVPPIDFVILTLTPHSQVNGLGEPTLAVQVQWGLDPAALGYEVYRDGVRVSALLPLDVHHFEDATDVVADTTYIYFVRAVLAGGTLDTPHVGVHVPVGLLPPPPLPLATERLENGSFTDGAAAWTLSGDFWAGTDGVDPWTSPGYAMGGVDGFGVARDLAVGEMHQAVAIPADATFARLSFRYRVAAATAFAPTDTMRVTIRDESGVALMPVAFLSNVDGASPGVYALVEFDLSAWKGTTIRVSFEVANDGIDPTAFQIDDVSVLADGS